MVWPCIAQILALQIAEHKLLQANNVILCVWLWLVVLIYFYHPTPYPTLPYPSLYLYTMVPWYCTTRPSLVHTKLTVSDDLHLYSVTRHLHLHIPIIRHFYKTHQIDWSQVETILN